MAVSGRFSIAVLFFSVNAMTYFSKLLQLQFRASRFASSIAKSIVLGAGAGLFFGSGNAQAVETIQLRYYGNSSTVPSEVTVSLDEIKTFVQAGELRQQVREFFNINRQDAGPVQRVFTQQIQVPANIGGNFVDTSVGRFVVTQLEKVVQGSNAAPNLRTALRTSIANDRSISLLEILENYPTETVAINITGLVQTYSDVSAFVDRVVPALDVAREYLQGIVCNCEQPATASGTTQSTASASASTCAEAQTATSQLDPQAALPATTP